jgi:hypothetical protein
VESLLWLEERRYRWAGWLSPTLFLSPRGRPVGQKGFSSDGFKNELVEMVFTNLVFVAAWEARGAIRVFIGWIQE